MWIEQNCPDYSFNLDYLAKAIECDSGKCLIYFYENHEFEVDKNPGIVLKAVQENLQYFTFFSIKMFLLKRYSKLTEADMFLKILFTLKKAIFHHEYIAESPFIYSTNPI